MGVWEYGKLWECMRELIRMRKSDVTENHIIVKFISHSHTPITSHTPILSHLYFPILHMHHPVAHLRKGFIMGNDQKSLIEFFPKFKE